MVFRFHGKCRKKRSRRDNTHIARVSSITLSRLNFARGILALSLEATCIDVELPTNGGYVSECMKNSTQKFKLNGGETLTLKQGWDGRPGHTGTSVWQSGKALAAYMEDLGPEFWSDKKVIELGCGTGLGSLTAHWLGAAEVLATDGNVDVLDLAEENIKSNRCHNRSQSSTIRTVNLKWGGSLPLELQKEWDIVIGSDLTYNGQVWIQLAETVAQLLDSNPACKFLYCSAKHAQFSAELSGFQTVIESKGLRWTNETTLVLPGTKQSASIAWIVRSDVI
mmetsp:Transcript_2879/g.4417  ORF Transcript_2879/g.4417 Transcript_2879/m.4417 type:complete len:280 (-) Transcript_2879:217-1056(-)